jgi:3-phenylpropionate/trans-cinnamate dioxygenase ferredoxin subunit
MTGTASSGTAGTGRPPARGGAKFVVGRASDIAEGERILVDVDGRSVGIFNVGGVFYAMLNKCPHMGAELCKGDVLNLIEADAPGEVRIDHGTTFIVCPWHGWEYDIATGQSWCNPDRTRARPFSVDVERGAQVANELADGSARGSVDDAKLVDPVRHRVKGPFVASVLPIEVEDEYIVVSLARLGPSQRKE